MDLQEKIENQVAKLNQEEALLKTFREDIKEELEENSAYVSLRSTKEKATKAFNVEKEALMGEPEMANLEESMKEVAEQIKDTKYHLTALLLACFRDNGEFIFETKDGEHRQISFNGKLKKRD